jgi:hypothetical protein
MTRGREEGKMVFAIEAWAFPSEEGEGNDVDFDSPTETAEFSSEKEARQWAWERMKEGYQTRLWKR